jgi:hypothetical protein
VELARERAAEEEEGERDAPSRRGAPSPAPGVSLAGPAQVLALQRGAGNAAVAKLMRLVTPTPVVQHTVAEVRAMTLGAFAAWARQQADWRTGPDFQLPANAAVRDQLFQLLEWAEAGADRPVLSACREMNVGALVGAGLPGGGDRTAMQAYANAVADDTFDIDSAGADMAKAVRWGRALDRLSALNPGVLRRVVKQNAQYAHLELLTNTMGDLSADFHTYVTTAPTPLLDSDREVNSYVALRRDGVDPQPLKGVIRNVRNLHRFHGTSLTALQNAWSTGNTSNLPFTLVLYPALDHNAAFHRDAHIDEVITNAHNFTLMIEGATTLAQITGLLPGLVGSYGKPDAGGTRRLQQVMIAGHGLSRSMELAGDAVAGHEGDEDSTTRNRSEDLDLDTNAAGTTAVFDALLNQMDPADPNSRILLNACLTASADFRPSDRISSSRRRASTQIAAIVGARPAFADVLRDRAAARGFRRDEIVSAANASFTSEAELIDPATGRLGLASPATYDPQLANPDRMEYIRDGSEPEGYMRAVLEFYGTRRPDVVAALRTKLASAERDHWGDRVTRAFARVSLYRIHEPHILAQMIEASYPLGELSSNSQCHVSEISRIPPLIVGDVFPRLLADPPNATWARKYNLRLVVLQRWARHSGHDAPLLAELAAHTAEELAPWVDLPYLDGSGVLRRLVSPGFAGAHGEGRLRLALLDAVGDAPSAASIGALRRLRGRRPTWTAADRTRIDAALGGLGTGADGVIDVIAEPVPVGGGGPRGAAAPPPPDANVDTDGDGTNDVFVQHMTRRGANAAIDVELRQRPDPAAPVTGRVPRGTTIFVIGRAEPGFLAVEDGATTRFVREPDLALLPTP